MHMRIDAMKVAAAVLTASNCRETVSPFANYTSSKGVSMETVETPLDPPLGVDLTTAGDTRIEPCGSLPPSTMASE